MPPTATDENLWSAKPNHSRNAVPANDTGHSANQCPSVWGQLGTKNQRPTRRPNEQ